MSEDRYRFLAALLPSQRKERAARYRQAVDRYTSTLAYCLLFAALTERTKRTEIIPPIFTFGPHGKPQGAPVRFNMAHCRSAVAVVLSEDDEEVGVDIEPVCTEVNPDWPVFTDRERQLRQVPPVLLWTVKEAFGKCLGQGLSEAVMETDLSGALTEAMTQGAATPSPSSSDCLLIFETQDQVFTCYDLDSHYLSACGRTAQTDVIEWTLEELEQRIASWQRNNTRNTSNTPKAQI